jgi:hypothetical protein
LAFIEQRERGDGEAAHGVGVAGEAREARVQRGGQILQPALFVRGARERDVQTEDVEQNGRHLGIPSRIRTLSGQGGGGERAHRPGQLLGDNISGRTRFQAREHGLDRVQRQGERAR